MTALMAPQVLSLAASKMIEAKIRPVRFFVFAVYASIFFTIVALAGLTTLGAEAESTPAFSHRALCLKNYPRANVRTSASLGLTARSATAPRGECPDCRDTRTLPHSLLVSTPPHSTRFLGCMGSLESPWSSKWESCLQRRKLRPVAALGGLEGVGDASSEVEASIVESSFPNSAVQTVDSGVSQGERAVPADFACYPFPPLGVLPSVERRLNRWGVYAASSVQASVLRAMLEGENVGVAASTGSGKTLAYLIALVQYVLMEQSRVSGDPESQRPLVVALLPTRELALQVLGWGRRLLFRSGISASLLLGCRGVLSEAASGPTPLSADVSCADVSCGLTPHFFAATPSSLASVARQKDSRSRAFFSRVGMIAIDEADLLLGGSFRKDMEIVLRECRRADAEAKRKTQRGIQYLLAAATLPDGGPKWAFQEVQRLIPRLKVVSAEGLHRHPERLQLEFKEVPVATSFQDRVRLLLNALVLTQHAAKEHRQVLSKALVFCNSTKTAEELCEALRRLLKEPSAEHSKVSLLTSSVHPQQRSRALRRFFKGLAPVLVCTDAAARGLHLPAEWVVQFDFATSAVSHLHRVGRVARVGMAGKALCFFSEAQRYLVQRIRDAYEGREGQEKSLDSAFSRKRSLSKKLKKARRQTESAQGQAETLTSLSVKTDSQADSVAEETVPSS